MPHKPRTSYTLVGLQFLALAILVLTGPLLARSPVWLALELGGLALAAWAVVSMRHSLPNVLPDVRASASLVQDGPFRWIRHPLYASLLFICGALLLDAPSPLRAATWLLLAATLIVKLRYEERLLCAAFPDYTHYQQHSWRLIPHVY